MLPRPFRFSSPLQRDLAVGGTIGAGVCSLAVIAGLTIGPTLGHKLPERPSGQAMPDVLSLPRVEHPALVKAEPARRRASRDGKRNAGSARPSATSVAQPTVRRMPGAPATPPRGPGRPGPGAAPSPGAVTPALPITVAPAPADGAPVTVPLPAGALDSLTQPKTARPVGTAVAARGLTLRVASVAVVRTDDPKQPELRVNMAITGATPGSGVPDQVALRLRPDLLSTTSSTPTTDTTSSSASAASTDTTSASSTAATTTGTTAPAPLALHTNVDVVTSRKTAAADAPNGAPALDMRVRMAVAPADPGTPTVRDRGDGGGKSNLIEVTVPLTAFAETTPDTPPPAPDKPAPAPDPDADPPATDTPAPGSDKPTTPGTDTPTTPGTDTPSTPTRPGTDAPSTPTTPGTDAPSTPTTPGTDAPTTPAPDAPANPPIGAPTDAPPPAIEVRLMLTAPAEPDSTPPTKSTEIPVTSVAGDPPGADPVPVTVVVDSAAAPSPPADVITDLPVETTPPAPAPADTTPVPGLGGLPPATTDTAAPVITDPAPTPAPTDPVVTTNTDVVAAPDPAAPAAP